MDSGLARRSQSLRTVAERLTLLSVDPIERQVIIDFADGKSGAEPGRRELRALFFPP